MIILPVVAVQADFFQDTPGQFIGEMRRETGGKLGHGIKTVVRKIQKMMAQDIQNFPA